MDPDPAIFVSDLQDVKKNQSKVFLPYFLKINLHHFSKIMKSQNSRNKCFLTIFAWWWKHPDPYLWLMDPDPGGPKTYGSCGSGSATLYWEGESVGYPTSLVLRRLDPGVSYPRSTCDCGECWDAWTAGCTPHMSRAAHQYVSADESPATRQLNARLTTTTKTSCVRTDLHWFWSAGSGSGRAKMTHKNKRD